ncbi:MAG: citramalate synthase [Nitrospirae bacterium]|nr:citramalate synthase [Nitrospirota bacterium]
MHFVEIYDTTLRDGAQAEDVSFSVEDKLRVAEQLDRLGVHYIEGGWPGSNPKDIQFFKQVRRLPLKNAKIAAFGATRKADNPVAKDANIRALLASGTDLITLFGKSWDFHVTDALGISLKKNLELIADSIQYLRSKRKRVFYDAEHFFDGYKANPDYALRTLKEAEAAGAGCIILCDTNGGTMPWEVREIFSTVAQEIRVPLGIHAHNDSDMAVANSIIAVELGAVQVQGTVNGFGERCGNANLCSILPNLKLKMKVDCISDEQLGHLKEVSRFVTEIANLSPEKHQPYVGDSAFAHKGGVHVHAVQKNPLTYEHVRPDLVGNRQRILVSDYAGRSVLLGKANEFRIRLKKKSPKLMHLLETLKDLEHQGFQFEGAEGSFELLMRKAEGTHQRFFDLIGFRVIVEKRKDREEPISEATITVKVGNHVEHTAAVGNGPVNALDHALRKALDKFYPQLKEMKLLDYKVRVLAADKGTAARVRVLIESGDRTRKWGTVGVSENIIEASWQALVDSVEYKLLQDQRKKR